MGRPASPLVAVAGIEPLEIRSARPSGPHRFSAALMLPREHGAWAMLLMPYAVGVAAAGWGGWASVLLLLSVLFLFISSRPLEVAAQRGSDLPEILARRRQGMLRVALYLIGASASGLTLLFYFGLWYLVPIGAAASAFLAIQLLLRRRRLDRTWPARLVSIGALSATGPAAYYTATGVLNLHAAAIWLLVSLYSGASIFYVRLYYRLGGRDKRPETVARARAEIALILYLVVAVVLAAALSLLRWLPPLAAVGFAPLIAKSLWALRRRDERPSLKQLGLAEIGHTTLFALLAAVLVRTW